MTVGNRSSTTFLGAQLRDLLEPLGGPAGRRKRSPGRPRQMERLKPPAPISEANYRQTYIRWSLPGKVVVDRVSPNSCGRWTSVPLFHADERMPVPTAA